MSDVAATNCGCGCECQTGGGSCSNLIFLILILCCCGGGGCSNGCFEHNCGCGFGFWRRFLLDYYPSVLLRRARVLLLMRFAPKEPDQLVS